ncbi:hypothetical protein ACC740_16780 [Rhizobium ruizarguesonis]
MPAITAIEWDILEARVNKTGVRHGLHTSSMTFLYLVLEQLFSDRAIDFPEMIVDGGMVKLMLSCALGNSSNIRGVLQAIQKQGNG